MNLLNSRVEIYNRISAKLSRLSDSQIFELLNEATPLHVGIGGKSVLLTIDGLKIFVKKVPLTDLERQPKNHMSTANLFGLPLCYQYGIGSAGFGAWREVTAHTITTNWVLSGECSNFSIMYYWRELSLTKPTLMNAEQLLLGKNAAESAVTFVENNLKAANYFMNERGLLHFDAHFENVLTEKIIKESFPDLEIAELIKIGEGFDNCAFEVNGNLIFRFPKHLEAAILLQNEVLSLSHIHQWFGDDGIIKIPRPKLIGKPSRNFPYLFYGYEKVTGKSACTFQLSEAERIALAPDFARFLKRLHEMPVDTAKTWQLKQCGEDRTDPVLLCHRIQENLKFLSSNRFFLRDSTPFLDFAHSVPQDIDRNHQMLIHGDLYARHLILSEERALVGIIDWGDIDIDHPAIDYQIVFTFFPAAGQNKFFEIYGNIDHATRLLAQLRALYSASNMAVFGCKTQDETLMREGLWSLDNWSQAVLR